MKFFIEIQDPTGATRALPITAAGGLVGADPSCEFRIHDSKAEKVAFEVTVAVHSHSPSEIWIQVLSGTQEIFLGDLAIRTARWPVGYTIQIGDTRLVLRLQSESISMPRFPDRSPHWNTQSSAGFLLLDQVQRVAKTNLSIFLSGETGTGKEILAHLLHGWSQHASGPLISLNCGALTDTLAESELFGHVKGAFTGAQNSRQGACIQAHGGTLFLDEVADLSPEIQVKLLRFLENGEIRPLGSDRVVKSNARVICASHRPLEDLVESGDFRKDLFYRVASVILSVPPLRNRPADIDLLASQFASQLGYVISDRALARLRAYSWPGNVRELKHAIERAVGFSNTSETLIEDAFDFLPTPPPASDANIHPHEALSLEAMEQRLLIKALRVTHGNRAEAAKLLGVSRSTVFQMMKRFQLTRTEPKTNHPSAVLS